MLDSLRSIVQEVNAAASTAEVLNIAVKRVKEVMQVGNCSIFLCEQSGDYVLRASDGYLSEAIGNVRIPEGEGLVGLIATREEPINLENASQHPNFTYIPETGEERFSSYLGAPIIHHRKVLGVALVQQEQQRRFDEGEEAFLVTICAQLAASIAHAEATGELKDQLSKPRNKKSRKQTEVVLNGIPSAPGIAIGTAILMSAPADLRAVARRYVKKVDDELALFKDAIRRTKEDLHTLDTNMVGKLSSSERALFEVYISMLDDHTLSDEVVALIREQKMAAQSAWAEVIREHVRNFERMEDAYLRERASDVRDLGRRVLAHLQQSQPKQIEYPDNCILIGEELAAPMLADVPHDKLVGMISVRGSRNSHMAILGRALGIPTVMGAVDLPLAEIDGNELIIDGHQGRIVAHFSRRLRNSYEKQRREEQLLAANLEQLRDEPCITCDDHRVGLWVNTGLRIDTMLSLDRGAEGVGLYRTEVPFLMHERFPSEEEQRKTYREQLEIFAPRPVTMRTLDVGGDKALPYFPIEEANPFLGWRGIRVTLDHPEIFLGQIRAMMKASEGLDNLRIMLPMISNIPELEAAMELIYRAFDELTKEEGFDLVMPKIGAMVEVPAAVYQIREIARRVHFLSVGTNDLTQYLLAVDRNNSRVADLYHAFHPALLNALQIIVDGAQRENCPVSVCGEFAGDPLGAVLLVGMGYDVLSMSSSNLLRVKAILRQVSLKEAKKLAEKTQTMADAFAVVEHLQSKLARPGVQELLGG
ncbi:phosphoenolpyruvate--protein phosphotransferase [Porticoccus sp. W117]|uniref:phosphoenolpyruvate--protein phosphotransferase n=1 Tax=Porticoccus sp. W117 TaxID=3054777 RepID=UPI0025963C36|nr:phosphoenolpyruvate--protein phosphotransferase [Porticoccus sp. W117]MDM3870914.1 phosphoenolpyruvate--protein phosphotransferase [Porticoccus sp. W117]